MKLGGCRCAAVALALLVAIANGYSEETQVVVQDEESVTSTDSVSFQRALLAEPNDKAWNYRKLLWRRRNSPPAAALPSVAPSSPPVYDSLPPPPEAPGTSPTTESRSTSPSAAQPAYLDPHNAARADKSLPPLAWDPVLEAYARDWGNHQKDSDNCALRHSYGPYGENLYWGWGKPWTPAEAIQAWVNEEQYYDYASNTCASGQMCGHYTQVVWKSTTRLGCASINCNDGSTFIICSYDPPGNYIGQKPY